MKTGPIEPTPVISTEAAYPSPARSAFVLGLLLFAILNAYVGRQVLALLASPVKAEFSFSDTDIGLLQGVAFNLSSGLASLPLGLLVDRGNRMRLIWYALFVWSTACALSGFATGYWPLFACRMIVGVSEAVLIPATYSLIPDLYPPRTRARATLIYYGGSLAGASLGIVALGAMITWLTNNAGVLPFGLGDIPMWRLTFILAGLSGLPLLILWPFAKEPARQEQAVGPSGSLQGIGQYLRENGLLVFCVCGGVVAMMVGVEALLTWTPTILDRVYGTETGRAGSQLGTLWGVGSIAGVLIAGALSVRLQRKYGTISTLRVVQIGAFASLAVLLIMPFVGEARQFLAVLALYFAALYIAASVGPILISSLAPNRFRGRIIALWVVVSALASAVAPTIVGALSDHVFPGPSGILLAVCAVAIPASLLGFLMLLSMTRRYRKLVGVIEN